RDARGDPPRRVRLTALPVGGARRARVALTVRGSLVAAATAISTPTAIGHPLAHPLLEALTLLRGHVRHALFHALARFFRRHVRIETVSAIRDAAPATPAFSP